MTTKRPVSCIDTGAGFPWPKRSRSMKTLRHSLLVLPLLAAVACSDTTGTSDGEVRVRMAAAPTAAASFSGTDFITASGSLTASMIDSIMVTVTAVEAIRVETDEAEDDETGGYVRLDLTETGGVRINLLDLPRDSAGIIIARDELRDGTYDRIRLRIEEGSATISLNTDVEIGGNSLLTAGTYDLVIPSSAQSGIKVKTASFTVGDDAGADVTLVFDLNTTVGNVHTTGNGKIMMNPVLKAGRVDAEN